MTRKYYRITHIPIQRPCPDPDSISSNSPQPASPNLKLYNPSPIDLEPLTPLIVEGYANSPYHACKVAFRTLISQGYISQAPLFNQETESFPNTEVEIIPEPEHEQE